MLICVARPAALGLLGEVRLARDADYEKWGIEIMVSFRDRKDNSADVELHVLSGHRQSGGVSHYRSVVDDMHG